MTEKESEVKRKAQSLMDKIRREGALKDIEADAAASMLKSIRHEIKTGRCDCRGMEWCPNC